MLCVLASSNSFADDNRIMIDYLLKENTKLKGEFNRLENLIINLTEENKKIQKEKPIGNYCILANSCPTNTIDKGIVGYIQPNNETCGVGTLGGPLSGTEWKWCHPRLCCTKLN